MQGPTHITWTASLELCPTSIEMPSVQREGPTIFVDEEEAGIKIESIILQETSIGKNMINALRKD